MPKITDETGLPTRDHVQKILERHRDKIDKALRPIFEDELGDLPFEEYERNVLEIVNEIARQELERRLQRMADGYGPRLRIDHNHDWHGIRDGTVFDYAEHEVGTVTYHSLVGGLRVRRFTYRECVRNGATYVPLELDAGIMEHMTPALAKCVAVGFADMPTRRLEQLMEVMHRRPPSRSTMERSARDLGAYASVANEKIEPMIRAQEKVPADARHVVLGLDRTAVPMRPSEMGRAVQYVWPDLRRSRPKGASSNAKGAVQWCMDYVGTVSFVDQDGQRILSRQYRFPSGPNPTSVVERMIADLRHALKQRPDLGVAVVQDGAPEMWNLVIGALKKEPLVRSWVEVLDWYHLDQRLTECVDLCARSERGRSNLRSRWRQKLLESNHGIQHVLRRLRTHRLPPEQQQQLDEHVTYLKRQAPRTRYASYRRRAIPIGSGVTEGACKSLVGMRAKRSGQRWSQRGLTAALHLRAIHQSERFDAFWPIFRSRYQASSLLPI
jgi:hypothetical protein